MTKRRKAAIVLYEDQAVPTHQFGLHKLVKACAWDEIRSATERHVFESLVDHRSLKGNSKIIKNATELLALEPGCHLIAVFDSDRVREMLGLSADAPDDDVIKAILVNCKASAERITVHLLNKNTESVIEAVRECARKLGNSLDPELLEQALRKDRAARDVLLNIVSRESELAMRDCIRSDMPSLRIIAESVLFAVRPHLALNATPH